MTFKQFYLLCLLGITLFSTIYLLLIWFEIRKRNQVDSNYKEINQGLFYIILGFLSWSIVAIYKLSDVKDFSLSYIINDRILSSLNNLFLISSIAFFPIKKSFYLSKFFQKKEQWVINVFIAFVILIGVFTITDKMNDGFGFTSRLIIVGFDSFVSIMSLFLFGYCIFLSYKEVSGTSLISKFIITIILGLSLTQIILPLTKLIPNQLSVFYPYALVSFIIFLSYFIFIILNYYTLLFNKIVVGDDVIENSKFNLKKNESIEIIEIKKIELGYDINLKKYSITLSLKTNENELIIENNSNSKLLQPFLYWLLFSISKKNDYGIFHQDIAISKFRMVEYWNRESNYRISQDVLFLNDNGNFCFKIDSNDIIVNDIEFFKNKIAVKELMKKHLLCFVDLDIFKKEQLTNRKKADKYIDENFNLIYQNIFSNTN